LQNREKTTLSVVLIKGGYKLRKSNDRGSEGKKVQPKVHAPHAPPSAGLSPVPWKSHIVSAALLHTSSGTVPDSAELLDSVRSCNPTGNAPGSGGCKLLESRWSSTREKRAEMVEGMAPVMLVAVRSLIDRTD
jgi:hypothetical protein